jgi:hypothetical protein
MALGISKTYIPIAGQVTDVSGYNTDISALFNAFSGLEAQTSSLGGLTITPTADSISTFKITNAAGTELLSADTTNSYLKLKTTSRLYLDGGGDSYLTESSANVVDLYVGATNVLKAASTYLYSVNPIYIGANSANNGIDNATGGTDSTTLYIGNQIIGTSTGTTGGTGSAGSGKQYVELKVGATTYKILTDGTI